MAEFRNEREFRAWLDGKPVGWARVLAVRAALVVLPRIVSRRGLPAAAHYERLVLASFRPLAVGWSATAGFARPVATKAAHAARLAFELRDSVHAGFAIDSVAAEAVRAAYADDAAYTDAARGAHSTVDAFAIAVSVGAVTQALAAIEHYFEFWRALATSATALEVGGSMENVLQAPIGTRYTDEWLKAVPILLKRDPNWRFWTDWYDDRLAGKSLNPAFERALLSLSEEEWERPVAEVNAVLMARMAVAEAEIEREGATPSLPPQDPRGAQIVVRSDFIVDFSDAPSADGFVRDAALQAVHRMLGAETAALLADCEKSNLTVQRLKPHLENFAGKLGAALSVLAREDSQIELWSAGLSLRTLAMDERRRADAGDKHDGWFDPAILIPLEGLVAKFNILNARLPRGAEFDENCRNPAPPDAASSQSLERMIDAQHDPAIFAPRVYQTNIGFIQVIQNDHRSATGIGARQTAEKTTRNVLVSMGVVIVGALTQVSGAVEGAEHLVRWTSWLWSYKEPILAFLGPQSDELATAFRWIFNHLPRPKPNLK